MSERSRMLTSPRGGRPVWKFPFELAPRDQRVLAILLSSILAFYGFDWIRDRVSGRQELRQAWIEWMRDPVLTTIDVNSAPAVELETLPRIGPKLAERVIEHRRRHGPFRSVDDLGRVPGIGPKTVEQLRPYVVVKEINQDSP